MTQITTTISQSEKLMSLGLNPETADMFYMAGEGNPLVIGDKLLAIGSDDYDALGGPDIPAWSLSALLELMPKNLFMATPKRKELFLQPTEEGAICFYRQFAVKTKGEIYHLTKGNTLLDAAFEMVVWLIENGYIKTEKKWLQRITFLLKQPSY